MRVALMVMAVLAAAGSSLPGGPGPARAQTPATPADLVLPAPNRSGGMPLLDALAARRSTRTFSERALPTQVLSDLLWAGWGVNRDDGRRTAPSARNWQEIDILVVLESGVYQYDAAAHTLRGLAAGHLRAATGGQPFVATAPLSLVYVADTERMRGAPPDEIDRYAWADAAFISQNVYLFCASEGLGTVVRAAFDRAALAEALGLPDTRRVILAQTVGYPVTGD
jgi:SagB-type dehydrogenase family enzyme